jgi:hypothetical protein
MAPLPDVSVILNEPIVSREGLRSGVLDAGDADQNEGEWR